MEAVETAVLADPLQDLLDDQVVMILDGGLASELEARGYDLGDELWSARLLMSDPGAIRDVHAAYLEAGADCVLSASYQATIEGFTGRGLGEADATDLLRLSVMLAAEARDEFWARQPFGGGRRRPLVAASVGPFGAALADGSEYTGDYAPHGMDEDGLCEWHRRRWEVLASCDAELLACETLPSFAEARALARLLDETPDVVAWFSFSCRDGAHVRDGTPLADCVAHLEARPRIVAVGVNCTAPRHVPSL
ncbi:MAG: homocysteine S-methyltransferase, partial [Planctomycetota bacterium]